jgi:hypothetical protein
MPGRKSSNTRRKSNSNTRSRTRSRSSSGVSESERKRKYLALKGKPTVQKAVIDRRINELKEKLEDAREHLHMLMDDFVNDDESHVTTKSFFTSKTHTSIPILKNLTGQEFTIEKMVRDV